MLKYGGLLCFVIINSNFVYPMFGSGELNVRSGRSMVEEIDVGVILDMGSWEAKILQSCISRSISDFYTIHTHYKTRLILNTRDSKGQPLRALASALDLLENSNLSAIIGGETSMEAKVLGELADKTQLPFISLSSPPFSSKKNPYMVQITQDEISQARGVAAIVEAFKWRKVVIIHEDGDAWSKFIPHLVDSLQEKNIYITYKTSLAAASGSQDIEIIQELHKLMALQQTVFLVHMSPSLTSPFFMSANKIGMMGEGYAWIMTSITMNHFHSIESSVIDSMQGVVGLKSYVPASKELHNFTSRMRKKLFAEASIEIMVLSTFCIWAHDAAWSLAKAVEKTRSKNVSLTRMPDSKRHINLLELVNSSTSTHDSMLIKEISQNKLSGTLSGDEFQFVEGKLVSNAFEIVNVIGRGFRRVGFWIPTGNYITRKLDPSNHYRGRQLHSTSKNLEDIIWPGGSATIPIGYVIPPMPGKKLRIAVPRRNGFPGLLDIARDAKTNIETVTGFCIDVFKSAMDESKFQVDYDFILFPNTSAEYYSNWSYDDIITCVHLQKFDAAVGDITITSNRSLYVDFTLPFTDLGLGLVAPKESRKNMWIFLEPLTSDLWLTIVALFLLTGLVIWLIERSVNKEFQGPASRQIGMVFWFSFSTLVFAHREKLLSNFSKFVVIVWVFVVLILTSSYTATLTSMFTVQHFQLNSKEYNIGVQFGSVFANRAINNLNFHDSNLKPLQSIQEYANALSRGSKHGGVSAIIDELPYIKSFLSKYSHRYSIIGLMPGSNGFGFVFPKGSPLVANMSGAIAKLREDGRLKKMEDGWFNTQPTFTSEDNSNNVSPLTIHSFRGLFLITGISSTSALAIFYTLRLYRNWHIVKNCNLCRIIRGQLRFHS